MSDDCRVCRGQGFVQDHAGLKPCTLCDCTGRAAGWEECPAGGEHVWTDEVDETRSDRRSRFYMDPGDRWHCDHCGASMPWISRP